MEIISYKNPRTRARGRRKRALIIFCVAATMIVLMITWMLTPRGYWSGAAFCEVSVTVLDSATAQPIPNATVQALDYSGAPSRFSLPATTGSLGIARTNMMVGAGGERSRWYDRFAYGDDEPLILVTAPGYDSTKVAPGTAKGLEVLGIRSKPRLKVVAKLIKSKTTQPVGN